MRNILKKTITSLLSLMIVTAIVFQAVKYMPKPPLKAEEQFQTSVFNNGFFDTNIAAVSTAEDMVKFSTIHSTIVTHMNTSYGTPALRDAAMKSAIQGLVGSKRIAIGSAEDLYNFSTAVSYNGTNASSVNAFAYLLTIEYLLGRNYALVADIDYSTMRAKKFNPIGIDLDLPGTNDPIYPFMGSFDGQGFTISNLYVADYSYITMIFSFDGEPQNNQDFPLAKSYAMFALVGQTGVIKNLVLRNPTYELLDTPEGLTKTSMFVGINRGTIYNVGVIDTKTNPLGDPISGIRINVPFAQSSVTYSAAGFVHTNEPTGKIYNSFFISANVMATGSKFRFDVKPFVYDNQAGATISNVAYDQMVIPSVDSTTQPATVLSYTSAQFRSGLAASTPININTSNLVSLFGEERKWNYYVLDGFPVLYGLSYQSGAFELYDEFDLIAFNKLMNFTTPYAGLTYDQHNYRLMANIDMKNLVGYQTPNKDYKGIFSGGTTEFSVSSTNNNFYISNLYIEKPAIVNTNYFMGFFSTVSGTVKNINFYNGQMLLTNTDNNYGKTFNIGSVVGKLNNTGVVRNIVSKIDIDLGTGAIGRSYVGGIVGLANNSVTYTANLGNINGNRHNFNNLTINAQFSIGGIVGAADSNTLKLTNSINKGNISGVGLSNGAQFNVVSGSSVINRVGGIIGELNNSASTNHSLVYVTNEGAISSNDFAGKSGGLVVHNLGGVFGEISGVANQITNPTNPITFRNGRWENKGVIQSNHINTFTTTNGAGIGVANTTTTKAEFSYMTNSGGFDYTNFNYGTHNTYLFYSATILDNSTGGIKLSRAYNTASYVFGPTYFASNSGIGVSSINIAPFFVSKNNLDKELLYVENRGEILIGSEAANSNVAQNLYVAGITLSNNVDYKNVSYVGTKDGSNYKGITLLRINNSATKEVYVAGITYALPYSTSQTRAYTMNNVINKGDIVVADFKGNSTIPSQAGTASGATTFSSTFSSSNLYVAGLVNINVGSLTNVFNYGNLTSEYNTTLRDIDGTANTFAGGITTFNYNFIQDAANSGNIKFTNSSAGTSYSSSSSNTSSSGALFAGLTYAYNGGVVLGGISAALSDTAGTNLTGIGRNVSIVAEVLDTANNGNIYGKARQYVRAGGVVGVALGLEITAGTDNATNVNAVKKFSSNITGSQDPVASSLMSNGLNFGNVTAITQSVYVYSTTDANGSQRPGIYSAAGGVVGYGLFRMKRMLNHGIVAATDVAGGIVGGTYIVGSTSSSSIPATIVDIDTAVHYGKVKAAKSGAYNNFTYDNSSLYTNTTYYYPDNDAYIFPTNSSPRAVRNKTGFGGIFGRLQRGTYGMMQSDNFINVLNMDPNIDMVGRTDQSAVGSLVYYRFSLANRDDSYYSARTNDTTPATLVGYITNTRKQYQFSSAATAEFRIDRSGTNVNNYVYTVTSIKLTNATGVYVEEYDRTVALFIPGGASTYTYAQIDDAARQNKTIQTTLTTLTNFSDSNVVTTSTSNSEQAIATYGITVAQAKTAYDAGGTRAIIRNNYTTAFTRTIFTAGTDLDYHMEEVTDSSTDPTKTYIFNPNFPLMNPTQSNYIYKAENEVLADRFRLSNSANYKPNGMYVLASTKGREAGAVLPQNVKIKDFFELDETSNKFIDLSAPKSTDVISDELTNANLLFDYRSMFQVKKSDKSLVLPKPGEPTIGDIVFVDPNGNSPTLEGGLIDNTAKTITFNVSQSAFPVNTVNYEAAFATLSENAVIAIPGITAGTHAAFKAAYLLRTSNIMGGAYKATFTGTFSANKITFPMTVYSEIAADDASLITVYRTVYTVTINRIPTDLNVVLNTITMNGTNVTPLPTLVGSTYTISPTFSLQPNGTIAVTYRENTTLLPVGHNVDVKRLVKDGDTVDPSFYNLTLVPKSGNLFGFTMTLSDELESGLYSIFYSYYNSSTVYEIKFTKQASTNRLITDVVYSTYSFDALGNNMIFTPTGNNFTTYIEFGEILAGVIRTTPTSLTVTPISNGTSLNYVNTVANYELRLAGNLLETVTVSPFTSITAATVYYQYDGNGRKSYVFTYTILNEQNQPTNITHSVVERNLQAFTVYKDGNQQFSYPVPVARESLRSIIQVDFNLTDSNLYQYISTSITDSNGPYTPTPDKIEFFNDGTYEINISYLLEVGLKTYNFALTREPGVVYSLGSLGINKNYGINAYLSDINFQLGSSITVYYPEVYEINSSGAKVTNSMYDMRTYFDGIDYGGADDNGVRYIRINGKVSDIDIVNYRPEFTLPFGAVIQRQVSPGVWSDDLFTNYISENELEDQVIRYRVLSEAVAVNNVGSTVDIADTTIVYYDLTAIDLIYNLTIRFTLYYQFTNGTIVEAGDSTSPIKSSVVLISLKNYNLLSGTNYVVTTSQTGDITYPFEGDMINHTNGIKNQSTLFYYPLPSGITNYIYTFGRNTTGAYNFSIVSPKYTGTTTTNLTNGLRYDYSIYLKTGSTGGTQFSWNSPNYQLPNFDSTGEIVGRYYFTPGSLRQIIREFAIVVEEKTTGNQWGLYDDYTSWDD